MSALSDYAENKVVDHILGTGTPWSMPTVYVSLHTAAPTEDGVTSNEVTGGWYARQQPATGWNAATTSGATNNGAITWSTITGSGVTVTHVGLYDALTGGNLLWYKAASATYGVGSVPTIPDAGMTVSAGGALSNYLIPKIIDHLLGTTLFTSPANVYLAMYTTNPTAADSGTEVSGGGYARQLITFDAGAAGDAGNEFEEDFGTATANLGTISHFGLRDTLTLGNLLIFGAWDTAKAVNNGDIYKVLDDTLTINAL